MQTLLEGKPEVTKINTTKSGWPIYLFAVLASLVAKLPTLNNNILFIDEPTYLIHAVRLNSLQTFFYSFHYRTEPKFQLGLLPDLLALSISSDNAILILRICGLIAVIISACLIINISKQVFKSAGPGLFSLTIWLILLNWDNQTASPLLEYFQTPLLLLCIWLFIKDYQSLTYLFWSGFSLALAVLVKPNALLVAPLLVLVLLTSEYRLIYRDRAAFIRHKFLQLLGFSGGVILPVGVFVLPYLLKPETLIDLKFNLLEVSSSYGAIGNRSIFQRATELLISFGPSNITLLFLGLALYLGSLTLIFKRRNWTSQDSDELLILAVGWVLFASFATGQAKNHYLIPILPFLMLFVGYRVSRFWRSLPDGRWRFTLALSLILWISYFEFHAVINYLGMFVYNQEIYRNEMPHPDQTALVNYIQSHTKPEDSIWVYYNAPEIYWLANRKPAINDSVGSWLVHIYTPFWFEKTARELAEERPAMIIGINEPRYPVTGVDPLTQIPLVKDWLAQNYKCDSSVITGTIICNQNTQADSRSTL